MLTAVKKIIAERGARMGIQREKKRLKAENEMKMALL